MVSAPLFLRSCTNSGGLGDIVELATAVLWDASTRKEWLFRPAQSEKAEALTTRGVSGSRAR